MVVVFSIVEVFMGIHYSFINLKDDTEFELGKNGEWEEFFDLIYDADDINDCVSLLRMIAPKANNHEACALFIERAGNHICLKGDDWCHFFNDNGDHVADVIDVLGRFKFKVEGRLYNG